MILPRFGAESQVGAGERGAQLRNQFFTGIGMVPEPLPQLPIAPCRVGRPMRVFVRQRRILREAVPERRERRHLHVVARGRVERLVPTGAEV